MFERYAQQLTDAVLRNDRTARWNDSLLFWFVGALLGWAAFGALFFGLFCIWGLAHRL
jgi:hypothetical protein